MKTTEKHLRTIRIFTAVFAAFFISISGRWDLLGEALLSPGFYVAVITSFVVAYLLMAIIHAGNRFLNRSFDWKPESDKSVYVQWAFYKRLIMQFVFCVMLPASLDLLFAGILIEATGRDFWTSGFLNQDFPVVVAFILFLNGSYIFNHFVFIRPNLPAVSSFLSRSDIQNNNTYMNLDIEHEIFCLIKEGKQLSLITINGDELPVSDTLLVLEEQFQQTKLYRINRSTFINSNTILGYRFGSKRRTVEIVLKSPFTNLIDHSRKEFLIVTGDHVPLIRAQFDRI